MATIVQQTNGEKTIYTADEYTLVQQKLNDIYNTQLPSKANETDLAATNSQLADIMTSIENYGAKANDPTFDNIPAIQAAVNYLQSMGGGTLYIPSKKTYYIKPSPTNFITTYDGITFLGGDDSLLKVVNNNGDWDKLIYNSTTGNTVKQYFRNLTIDCNIQNNPSTNITVGGHAQIVIRTEFAGILKVNQCRFLNTGGTNVIVTAGGYDTAIVDISNNEFYFTRGTGTPSIYDVSILYIDAKILDVHGNKFISTANDLAGTCMELHGTITHVSRNYVSYFQLGLLSLLPLYSSYYSKMRWDFHDNTFDNMKIGFSLSTFSNYSSSINTFKNVSIHHNSIHLNPVVYNSSSGTNGFTVNTNTSSSFTMDTVTFESNQVSYEPDVISGSRTENYITSSVAIQLLGNINYSNWTISDNKFINVPSSVISFLSTAVSIGNFLIRNNLINNAGCGLPSLSNDYYKAVLRINGNPPLSNVILNNNLVVDTGNPANTLYFVSLYSYNLATTLANILIRSNNKLLSQYGSIGCMPIFSGDDENRKSLYEWSKLSFQPNTNVNGIITRNNDIIVTPSKAYSVTDGTTGTLQTASAGTVTGSITSGTNLMTVNDTTNIKAGQLLKITDGVNNLYPLTVKYVLSPTQLVITTNSNNTFNNGTVTYYNPTFTDIYNQRYGSSAISAGTTSVTVNHGCGGTPTSITVTPTGNIGNFWVNNVGSSQFTINCATAPASSTSVYWRAQV